LKAEVVARRFWGGLPRRRMPKRTRTFRQDKARGDEMPDWGRRQSENDWQAPARRWRRWGRPPWPWRPERKSVVIEARKMNKQRQAEARQKPGKPRPPHRTTLIPSRQNGTVTPIPDSRIMKSRNWLRSGLLKLPPRPPLTRRQRRPRIIGSRTRN